MFPRKITLYQLQPFRRNYCVVFPKLFHYSSPFLGAELRDDPTLIWTDSHGRLVVGHIATGRKVVVAEDTSHWFITVLYVLQKEVAKLCYVSHESRVSAFASVCRYKDIVNSCFIKIITRCWRTDWIVWNTCSIPVKRVSISSMAAFLKCCE